MDRQLSPGRTVGPSRIMLDLAAGNLDEDELEALVDWLTAGAINPPDELVELGVRIPRGRCASVR